MSPENDKENDMDSIHLVDYLKKEIPVEDIRDFASPRRILSIDFVKGFAIIMIMIAHTAGAWLDTEWRFIYGVVYTLLDFLGPSLFVFLSALSVVFSIRRKRGALPDKVIRNRIITRGIIIIFIGIIFNMFAFEFTISGFPFPWNMWGWSILVFIGFSQIFSFYALKLNRMGRVIVGIFIIFSSEYIVNILSTGRASGNPLLTGLHYIIVSPVPMTPVLPWLSICFISTIFGELLYDAMIDGTKQGYTVLFRTFLYWGIFFMIFGMFLGFKLQTPATVSIEDYPHLILLEVANSQNITDFRWPGMPDFMIRGKGSNMWYNLGAGLIIIAVSFYYLDIKEKKNDFISMMKYYGKVSLSLFLVHYTFIALFLGQYNIFLFVFICLGYIGLMGFLMYIWIEFANGVGSPEWLMVQIGRIGQKTGKTVKKEIHIIEEEIKELTKKFKKEDET